jgi:hypothetical protein
MSFSPLLFPEDAPPLSYNTRVEEYDDQVAVAQPFDLLWWDDCYEAAEGRTTPLVLPSVVCLCWEACRRCDVCTPVGDGDLGTEATTWSAAITPVELSTSLSEPDPLPPVAGRLARFLLPASRTKHQRSRKRGRTPHNKAKAARWHSPSPVEEEAAEVRENDSDSVSSLRTAAPSADVDVGVTPSTPRRRDSPAPSCVPSAGSVTDSPPRSEDRVVISAEVLGVDSDLASFVPLYYPSKPAADPHRVRLIRVKSEVEGVPGAAYVYAADLGGVVERKSNISRLFGEYDSPSQKRLMHLVGDRSRRVGQEFNVVTAEGVRRFLQSSKMQDEPRYTKWVRGVLLPALGEPVDADPLEESRPAKKKAKQSEQLESASHTVHACV